MDLSGAVPPVDSIAKLVDLLIAELERRAVLASEKKIVEAVIKKKCGC